MTEWEPHPSMPNTFQRFACDPPPEGAAFRVLRQEWDEDLTHRTILEVQLIDGPGAGGSMGGMTCGLSWFTPHKVSHECQRPEGHSGIHSCQCGEGLWPHEVDQAELDRRES